MVNYKSLWNARPFEVRGRGQWPTSPTPSAATGLCVRTIYRILILFHRLLMTSIVTIIRRQARWLCHPIALYSSIIIVLFTQLIQTSIIIFSITLWWIRNFFFNIERVCMLQAYNKLMKIPYYINPYKNLKSYQYIKFE